MKALNKESILDCDELETELHDAEIKQLDEQLFLIPNYPCEFEDRTRKIVGSCVFYGNHLKMLPQTHMDNWASKIFVHPAV